MHRHKKPRSKQGHGGESRLTSGKMFHGSVSIVLVIGWLQAAQGERDGLMAGYWYMVMLVWIFASERERS